MSHLNQTKHLFWVSILHDFYGTLPRYLLFEGEGSYLQTTNVHASDI